MEARIANLRRKRAGKRSTKGKNSKEEQKEEQKTVKPMPKVKFQEISLSSPPKPTFTLSQPFVSVLSQPFSKWNELEHVIGEFAPEWNYMYRSYITMHLVRFLELKVMIEEFSDSPLLSPSRLIARAWQALILVPNLYMEVTYDIQDFHRRPRLALSHELMKQIPMQAYMKRLERTQRLLNFHYHETMPITLDDIELDLSMKTETSALTDVVAAEAWHLTTPPCAVVGAPQCAVVRERRTDKRKGTKTTPTPPRVKKENFKFGLQSMMSNWMCWDAMKDALNFKGEDSSLEETEIVDDIEELSANFIQETAEVEEKEVEKPKKPRKFADLLGENAFLRRIVPLGAFHR